MCFTLIRTSDIRPRDKCAHIRDEQCTEECNHPKVREEEFLLALTPVLLVWGVVDISAEMRVQSGFRLPSHRESWTKLGSVVGLRRFLKCKDHALP